MKSSAQTIGIVGAGPMATYVLQALIASKHPQHITVVECSARGGSGMPYSADMNAAYMYCNAFSHEIPAITQSLTSWLESQDSAFFKRWNLDPERISSRAFYPRVLIGKYLESEFDQLCQQGLQNGHQIEVLTGCKVIDISPDSSGGAECFIQARSVIKPLKFNKLIIATGHDWPKNPKIDQANLVSPWPYTRITALKAGPIGVLGSSLSAIDAVIALGFEHGTFTSNQSGLTWSVKDASRALAVSMVSHKGIMPEPDFYYPYPYAPLQYINQEAVCHEVSKGSDQLLKRVFQLLIKELRDADPEYLSSLGSDAQSIEGFAEAYFERRMRLGGLNALGKTLKESKASEQHKEPIAHRYALLRAHESFGLILEHLSEADWHLFMEHLMPVFADCYAAVPHVSVERILAMYEAGVLEIVATGESSEFKGGSKGVMVSGQEGITLFDAMIDARGQKPAAMNQLPFKKLNQSLRFPELALCQPFEVPTIDMKHSGIYCLAMPQLLERHPFSQGLANCQALADQVVRHLSRDRLEV